MSALGLISCEDADERYTTVRVMGGTDSALLDHAITCPRYRWQHALPTELWHLADFNRKRLRLWEVIGAPT